MRELLETYFNMISITHGEHTPFSSFYFCFFLPPLLAFNFSSFIRGSFCIFLTNLDNFNCVPFAQKLKQKKTFKKKFHYGKILFNFF